MTFTAESTGQAVKAVLFDVFGTVVDWRTGVAAAVRRFAGEHGLELDASAFADAWRSRYVPGMRRVSTGERPFVPLDVLHRENLDGVLRDLGLDSARFGPAALDELNLAWHFLPPWRAIARRCARRPGPAWPRPGTAAPASLPGCGRARAAAAPRRRA